MGNEWNDSARVGVEAPGIVPDDMVEIDGHLFEANPGDRKDWLAPPVSGWGFYRFCDERFAAWLKWQGYGPDGKQGVPPQLPQNATSPSDAMWKQWRKNGVLECTYFALGLDTGRIKIGRSKQPEYRVSSLHHTTHGETARMLVYLWDDFEAMYHNTFAEWLVGNEWFAPHPDLMAEVARLQAVERPHSIR